MNKISSKDQHEADLLRRRIKFVVEKGAMARLFRKRKSQALQKHLFNILKPKTIASFRNRDAYDRWLTRLVESECWKTYSRLSLKRTCWAYFAKLVNIVIYEIASNRELLSSADWKRIQYFLHIPIDSKVLTSVRRFDSELPQLRRLKGMTKETYVEIQNRVRRLAKNHKVPPIWFEAAYSAEQSEGHRLLVESEDRRV